MITVEYIAKTMKSGWEETGRFDFFHQAGVALAEFDTVSITRRISYGDDQFIEDKEWYRDEPGREYELAWPPCRVKWDE